MNCEKAIESKICKCGKRFNYNLHLEAAADEIFVKFGATKKDIKAIKKVIREDGDLEKVLIKRNLLGKVLANIEEFNECLRSAVIETTNHCHIGCNCNACRIRSDYGF